MGEDGDMEKDLESMSFEDALVELEGIVSRLEEGDLMLEEALTLFERGQSLAAHCNQQLDAAKFRVEQLTEHGEIVEIET
jgi:exodeoxyribonuclease VII small subunit